MAKKQSEVEQDSAQHAGKAARDRLAFSPGEALSERIRNYVYWQPGASVNQFLLDAALREMDRLEKELNKGKPWPPRKGRLKTGRQPS